MEAENGSIVPALTAEQWAALELRAVTGDAAVDEDDGYLHTQDVLWVGKERQGIAALALHGQPFGFTWEDVDRLRYIAERVPMERVGDDEGLSNIADRIAALLPPR
jgi:hypothetical protein